MLIKEENTLELGVRDWVIASVVLIIVKIEEIGCEIHTSEGVIRERTPSTMDLHGSMSCSQHIVYILNVVGKLNSVSQDEHPRLSEIGYLRWVREDSSAVWNHDLLSS